MIVTKELIFQQIKEEVSRRFGCDIEEATPQQMYTAVCTVARNLLADGYRDFENKISEQGAKKVYYMSMEFLVGTSLHNNLFNLGLEEYFREIVEKCGGNIDDLYEMDPDAGLGNGGLGRLASCYMDSMTTQSLPCQGFSIRYEFGIFRQKIVDGWQMEQPDNWLEKGAVWLNPRMDEVVEVKFDGYIDEQWTEKGLVVEHRNANTILAVPHDMYISGYHSDAVNKLVLWSAKSVNHLDMSLFSRGEYVRAMEQSSMAEAISMVLYPADDHIEGKSLRLSQQYMLVSASLQTIIRKHIEQYGTLDSLQDKVAIHINDTHPALCVPELMRILMDEHDYSWEDSWEICGKVLAYTNHTVMAEAMETWPVALFAKRLPRIYQIVQEIDRRFRRLLYQTYPGDYGKIEYMAPLSGDTVKMANLCLCCCHKVNGVSALHTDILKNNTFRDFYNIMPDKFTNVTNGIAYRRWLCQGNPELTGLLTELIGTKFQDDATALEDLMRYADDKQVYRQLETIKYHNKQRMAEYILKNNGIIVDPSSIFDVQVKRLHEYKRQLLNVLHILYLYYEIKDNPGVNMIPRTFLFAAKASPGYFMAKQIIRLINSVADMVNNDPVAHDRIKVVFLENYSVSLSEIIMPSANLSEQISVAGKEASGTGNMKLMINGAVTMGTLDGANVEILEQVGADNIFIFGMNAQQVNALWQSGYHPLQYYQTDPKLRRILDLLKGGINGTSFSDVAASLLTGFQGGTADAYMALADFESYRKMQSNAAAAYANQDAFSRMSLVNIAKAGFFSADRSVSEYAKNIWKLKSVR